MAYPAADHYVDPAAAGNNDGTSWTDAWTDMQSAVDNATAGENVYMRGTQTLALNEDIDFDGTNSGDTVSGHIRFYGCDASGTCGADEFTIDANSAAAHCIKWTGVSERIWFEHIKCINATDSGVSPLGVRPEACVFKHCIFADNGAEGLQAYYLEYSVFIHCIFRNNGDTGFSDPKQYDFIAFCLSEGNTGKGFILTTGDVCYGCLAYENTSDGFQANDWHQTLLNCVSADNGASAINLGGNERQRVIACRLTDSSEHGIESTATATDCNYADFNLFNNNTDADDETTTQGLTDGSSQTDPAGGSGYVDAANDNYEVASGKELRSTAIDLDWDV